MTDCAIWTVCDVAGALGLEPGPEVVARAIGCTDAGTLLAGIVRGGPELGLAIAPAHVPPDLVAWLVPPCVAELPPGPGGPHVAHVEAVVAATDTRPRRVRAWGEWHRADEVVGRAHRRLLRAAELVALARDWPLVARLAGLPGIAPEVARELVAAALADPTGRAVAALDAGARYVAALRDEAAIGDRDVMPRLRALIAADDQIPGDHWRVRPLEPKDVAALEWGARATDEELAAARAGAAAHGPIEVVREPEGWRSAWGSGWVVADLAIALLVRRAEAPSTHKPRPARQVEEARRLLGRAAVVLGRGE